MPPPAPVTIATFSSNCIVFLSVRVLGYDAVFASTRDTTPHSTRLDPCGNGFGFEIFLETGEPHLPADAGLLVSAERHVGGVPDAAVYVHRADAHPRRDTRGTFGIGREHGAG